MRSLTRVSVLMGPPWLVLIVTGDHSPGVPTKQKALLAAGPSADRSRRNAAREAAGRAP